ncbi:hypothetical protein JNW90_33510 [Micromonospora sp. STR1s_5]|nr:hypothetical protein [Micromonospora sp. STR1s_5]
MEIVGPEAAVSLLRPEATRPWSHRYLQEQVRADPRLRPSFQARARAMASWEDFAILPPTRTFADVDELPVGVPLRHVGGGSSSPRQWLASLSCWQHQRSPRPPRLVALATVLGGTGSGAWNVTYSSLRALVVPDEMMGRYSGVSRLTSWGSMPLGALVAGLTAELVSVRAVFWGDAALCALALAVTLRTVTSPEFRRVEARATALQEPAPAQPH